MLSYLAFKVTLLLNVHTVRHHNNGFQRNSHLARFNSGSKINNLVIVLNTNSILYNNNKPLLTKRCLPVDSEKPDVSLMAIAIFRRHSGNLETQRFVCVILLDYQSVLEDNIIKAKVEG